MEKKVLNQLKIKLKDRRHRLLNEVSLRLNKIKISGSGKLSDTADLAANLVEDEIVMSVAQGEAKEIAQIDNALKKIQNGNYGICECCGKDINKQRLQAIPFVSLCVKCKEEEERYEDVELGREGCRLMPIEYVGSDTDDDKRSSLKGYDISPYDN